MEATEVRNLSLKQLCKHKQNRSTHHGPPYDVHFLNFLILQITMIAYLGSDLSYGEDIVILRGGYVGRRFLVTDLHV